MQVQPSPSLIKTPSLREPGLLFLPFEALWGSQADLPAPTSGHTFESWFGHTDFLVLLFWTMLSFSLVPHPCQPLVLTYPWCPFWMKFHQPLKIQLLYFSFERSLCLHSVPLPHPPRSMQACRTTWGYPTLAVPACSPLSPSLSHKRSKFNALYLYKPLGGWAWILLIFVFPAFTIPLST